MEKLVSPERTMYSEATGCYCKECPYEGYTCNSCTNALIEAKNALVRENNALRHFED